MAAWTLLLLAAAGAESRAADPPPFAPFAGTYGAKSRVQVFEGSSLLGRGHARLRFSIAPDGQTAQLKISGKIRIDGASRPYTTILGLRRKNVAAISNLAPAVDDGHSAREGTYSIAGRNLQATIPFLFGTTVGQATLTVHVRKQGAGTRLIVREQLETSAAVNSYIWKFSALSRH